MTRLTIGSRGSQLALWQANFVAAELAKTGIETRIEIIKTTGDHLQTASLVQAGGKGLFTKEIEEALLADAIDLAVHSLKDLPTEMPAGLHIAAIPPREDPRDALIGSKLASLSHRARVGTSSERRAAQLRALRPDLLIEPIRGNVDTRLRKLKEGQYDAIVLAAAGLNRLQLSSEIEHYFSPDEICPAPGQGALAIQTRVDGDAYQICTQLNHEATQAAVTCERTLLAALGGGCQLPVGAYAEFTGIGLHLKAVVISPDGSHLLRAEKLGESNQAFHVGSLAAAELIERGARAILAGVK